MNANWKSVAAWFVGCVSCVFFAFVVMLGLSLLGGPINVSGLSAMNKRGRDVFRTKCEVCHATTASMQSRCPTLADVGKWASERVQGMSKERFILQSILEPNAFKVDGSLSMPEVGRNLTDDQLREVVYFLGNLGGTTKWEDVLALEIQRPAENVARKPIDRELLEIGEAVFFGNGNCVACHRYESTLGPLLQLTSEYSPEYLRKSIQEPHDAVSPKYRQSILELEDGTILSGMVLSRDNENLTLRHDLGGTATIEVIPLSKVQRDDDGNLKIKTSSQSLMPSFENVLNEREVDGLVELLRSLR